MYGFYSNNSILSCTAFYFKSNVKTGCTNILSLCISILNRAENTALAARALSLNSYLIRKVWFLLSNLDLNYVFTKL